MKKFFVSFLLSLVILPAFAQKDLTVVAWNVWHKGHSELYGQKACDGCMGILQQSGADVILMVETYGAAPMVAQQLGYEYHLISSNLCVYSRYPILETYAFPDLISTFNFGGAMIDVDGQKVRVFPLWIHYLPDQRLAPVEKSEEEIIAWECAGSRDEEIHSILQALDPFLKEADDIPVIIGGDFNSFSHLDWTQETKDRHHHGGAVVRWPVSTAVVGAGFTDSFREVHPNPIMHPGTTWLTGSDDKTINRYDRIDYIYYKGSKLKATQSDCYDWPHGQSFRFLGKDFLYPSDHGFVRTVFNILSKP